MLSIEEIKKQIEEKARQEAEAEKKRLGDFKNEEEKKAHFLKQQEQIERVIKAQYEAITGKPMLDTEVALYRSFWKKDNRDRYPLTKIDFLNKKGEKTREINNLFDFVHYQNELLTKGLNTHLNIDGEVGKAEHE